MSTKTETKAAQPAAKKPEAATALDAVEAFETQYADAIAERVAAGLTHEQAVSVQRAQIREDLANAK